MQRKFFLILPLFLMLLAVSALSAQQQPSADAAKPTASATAQAAPQPAPSDAAPGPAAKKEDWTALSLEKSGLDISRTEAVLIAKWEKPDFTEELLRVQWRPNDPIDLYVILPHGVAKPPAILYLYDYLSDTERFRDEGWCKRATKDGFAAVGFLSAMSGDRFHAPHRLNQWFVSELQESLGSSAHDVQMILNYLATRGDIDMSRIGIFGQGSGGAIAVLAAAVDPRIRTLDLFNAWGDWPNWLKDSPLILEKDRANFVTPEFLNKAAKLDPAQYLPQLNAQKVRIEYILDDPTTPKQAREIMLAAAPKAADVVRYKDTDEHAKAWRANGLSGWLKSQLQAGQQQTPTQPKTDSTAAGVASNRP
jgi:hypothetical protein